MAATSALHMNALLLLIGMPSFSDMSCVVDLFAVHANSAAVAHQEKHILTSEVVESFVDRSLTSEEALSGASQMKNKS